MINVNEYEAILDKAIIYLKDSRKILNGIEQKQGWIRIASENDSLFKSTSFFMYGIEKYKTCSTADKYLFLKTYHTLYFFGFIGQKENFRDTSEMEDKLFFQSDIYEIFGNSLVTANAQQVELNSSFDSKDYIGKPLPPGSVFAFEFAPIIDAWFDMWIEFKNEWKDDFNERYLSYDLLNTLHPKLPAYQRFLEKREAIVDHLLKTGRITTKDPARFT